jgi:16S rRNA (uracil1498-N3)-methyltransferase
VPPSQAVTLIVGPEGGWTDDERDFARDRGATLLTLGVRTLRAERAALVALAVLTHRWGDL